jgi:hypothetical protein
MNNETNEGYELRFFPNNMRIVLPHVIPYLIQKKEKAKIILRLLDYRSIKHHDCEEREKFYLQLEDELRSATMVERPWLLKTVVSRTGKLDSRNLNLVKGFQTHTYIRNPRIPKIQHTSPVTTEVAVDGKNKK